MDRQALAARNNAEWYEAIARAHGIPGRYESAMWLNDAVMPPYYSNGVTLSAADTEAQYAAIDRLRAKLKGPFSIKDGFNRLDLADRGFGILFEAEWMWLDPATLRNKGDPALWSAVGDEAELAAWEAAWNEGGSPADTRVFPQAVLVERSITLLAVRRGGRIVAGCAANSSTGDVVGFSNFFTIADDIDALYASAVSAVGRTAPGWPIVGYERGENLDRAVRSGFLAVGNLRIWSTKPNGR